MWSVLTWILNAINTAASFGGQVGEVRKSTSKRVRYILLARLSLVILAPLIVFVWASIDLDMFMGYFWQFFGGLVLVIFGLNIAIDVYSLIDEIPPELQQLKRAFVKKRLQSLLAFYLTITVLIVIFIWWLSS